MPANFSNSQQLLHSISEGYYKKLLAQLKKDFERANVPIAISIDTVLEDLIRVLHEKVYYLILEHFPDYLNVLYVVDVPERVFKEIEITDVVEVSELVTFLILKREWEKVVLKEKYS